MPPGAQGGHLQRQIGDQLISLELGMQNLFLTRTWLPSLQHKEPLGVGQGPPGAIGDNNKNIWFMGRFCGNLKSRFFRKDF